MSDHLKPGDSLELSSSLCNLRQLSDVLAGAEIAENAMEDGDKKKDAIEQQIQGINTSQKTVMRVRIMFISFLLFKFMASATDTVRHCPSKMYAGKHRNSRCNKQ